MKQIIGTYCLAMIMLVTPVLAGNIASGGYYTGTKETVSVGVPEVTQSSPKKAVGGTTSILYLVAFGDASVNSLAAREGITKIHRVDKETFSLFFFFKTETFTVYGE